MAVPPATVRDPDPGLAGAAQSSRLAVAVEGGKEQARLNPEPDEEQLTAQLYGQPAQIVSTSWQERELAAAWRSVKGSEPEQAMADLVAAPAGSHVSLDAAASSLNLRVAGARGEQSWTVVQRPDDDDAQIYLDQRDWRVKRDDYPRLRLYLQSLPQLADREAEREFALQLARIATTGEGDPDMVVYEPSEADDPAPLVRFGFNLDLTDAERATAVQADVLNYTEAGDSHLLATRLGAGFDQWWQDQQFGAGRAVLDLHPLSMSRYRLAARLRELGLPEVAAEVYPAARLRPTSWDDPDPNDVPTLEESRRENQSTYSSARDALYNHAGSYADDAGWYDKEGESGDSQSLAESRFDEYLDESRAEFAGLTPLQMKELQDEYEGWFAEAYNKAAGRHVEEEEEKVKGLADEDGELAADEDAARSAWDEDPRDRADDRRDDLPLDDNWSRERVDGFYATYKQRFAEVYEERLTERRERWEAEQEEDEEDKEDEEEDEDEEDEEE